MKKFLFSLGLVGTLIFVLGCSSLIHLAESPTSLAQRNYALSENGARIVLEEIERELTSEVDALPQYAPRKSLDNTPDRLIDGDRSTSWEIAFSTYYHKYRRISNTWNWWVFEGKTILSEAAVVIPIRFPKKRVVNKVVVYTIDTPSRPASRYGVKDIAVHYLTEEFQIPERREGPSKILVRKGKQGALWRPVTFYSEGINKRDGRIRQNKKGKIVFEFRPVLTEAIRIVIFDTNDSVISHEGSSGYGYYYTPERKGIVRLMEVEVYGPQKIKKEDPPEKQKLLLEEPDELKKFRLK